MNRTTLTGEEKKKKRKRKEKKNHEICEWIWVRKNCKRKRGGGEEQLEETEHKVGEGKKKV